MQSLKIFECMTGLLELLEIIRIITSWFACIEMFYKKHRVVYKSITKTVLARLKTDHTGFYDFEQKLKKQLYSKTSLFMENILIKFKYKVWRYLNVWVAEYGLLVCKIFG